MSLLALNIGGKAGQSGLSGRRSGGGWSRGGLYNWLTGAGGESDKMTGAEFLPSYYSPYQLQTIYVESWAAQKFIDIPVLDMWVRGREFINASEEDVKKVKEMERALHFKRQLVKAMRGARTYGSSMLVMMTRGVPMHRPLNLGEIREGDLVSLPVFHRWQCTIASWKTDPRDPDYGSPDMYSITPTIAQQAMANTPRFNPLSNAFEFNSAEMLVHASRVLRFDGVEPMTNEGWEVGYERDWGISNLVAALEAIIQETSTFQGTTQQVNEADIETVKIQSWNNAVSGEHGPDDPSIDEIGAEHSREKSQFRTRYIDANDEVTRTSINFAGRPDLIDRYWKRLAAIAGIPLTRFMEQSPAGMNATGESDMKNYAISVKARQEDDLADPVWRLDSVMAKSLGLKDPLEYRWIPLMDMSEKEMAEVAFKEAETLKLMYDMSAVMEDEVRETMKKHPMFDGVDLKSLGEDDLAAMREMHGMESEEEKELRLKGMKQEQKQQQQDAKAANQE